MKKWIILLAAALAITTLPGCASQPSYPVVGDSRQAVLRLTQGNKAYQQKGSALRKNTAENGQSPYAVVITCSDSRVVPELIFDADIGELFVVRTAGNVLGELELGSVEYGVEHLGATSIVVLGHSGCGAVAATLSGVAHGNITAITEKIAEYIGDETDTVACEDRNIQGAAQSLLGSKVVKELVDSGNVSIVQMKYDLATGATAIK